MDDTDDRLIEIETRLAFQDRTIEALHEVVLGLRGEIDRLRRDLAETKDKLDHGGPETGPAHEPPPHW